MGYGKVINDNITDKYKQLSIVGNVQTMHAKQPENGLGTRKIKRDCVRESRQKDKLYTCKNNFRIKRTPGYTNTPVCAGLDTLKKEENLAYIKTGKNDHKCNIIVFKY